MAAPVRVGYARVSTVEQDVEAQRAELDRIGVDQVHIDHGLTGRTMERPGLQAALAAVRAGDVLVVTKLDRLARSTADARTILEDLTAREVALNIGGAVYDPSDPMGKMFLGMLALIAEFEADLIRQRTKEGMALARARGRLRGSKPKLNPRQRRHLLALHDAGESTISELMEDFGISRSTVYRYLEAARANPTPAGTGYGEAHQAGREE